MNDKEHPEYILRFNDINDRNTSNNSKNHKAHYIDFRKQNDEEKEKIILKSGLNNLEYKVMNRVSLHYHVELIQVCI